MWSNTTRQDARGRGVRALGALVAVLALVTSCNPFDVLNPGPIDDTDLDLEEAGLVVLVGIVGEVEVSLDAFAYFGGVASSDLSADATRPWVESPGKGDLLPADGEFQWDPGQSALWVATDGIRRLEASQPNPQSSPLVAAAYLWAGYANRILGDNVCVAIFDGGPALAVEEHYLQAITQFEEARSRAASIGASVDSIRLAAIAGLAQSHLILGNYAVAAGFAQQIPDDFLWVSHRSSNSDREFNTIFTESHEQKQITVHDTYTAALGVGADPRVPFEDLTPELGASGVFPFLRQLKYTSRGSDIPLAKGAEMRLIEAEALLRGGDMAGAMVMINQVRTTAGVATVSASTVAEAYLRLDQERHLVLWLEGRRLKDNQRFSETSLSSFSTDFMLGRDRCFPPSLREQDSNQNL